MLSLFFAFFFAFVFYVCIICVKSINKPVLLQYCIADCVTWVAKLTWTNEQIGLTKVLQNGTRSCVGDSL